MDDNWRRIPQNCGYNEGMSAPQSLELHNAHIAIAGLGLMGGSLALALKSHVRKLTAVDLDAATRRAALEHRLVDEATATVADLGLGQDAVDMLVLATPVRGIMQIMEQLPGLLPRGCAVLDLGSTKGQVCAAMDALPPAFSAIGGHPMCGKETSGLGHAQEDLYRDQTFILCRTARTNRDLEQLALRMLQAIGARPLFLQPEEHDRLVAQVSHLPYFLAALLIQQSTEQADVDERLWEVSASGFRDTSRLAGSAPRMFYDIAETNRQEIVRVLRRHASFVEALIEILDGEAGAAGLEAWLQARHDEYRAYRTARGDRS